MEYLWWLVIFSIPIILTLWNGASFIKYAFKKEDAKNARVIEMGAMLIGLFFLSGYISLVEITFAPWNEQLYNSQKHSVVFPEASLTVGVLFAVGFVCYLLLRFIPAEKQSPLVCALGIAGVYIEIALCIVWCIQTMNDFILTIVPLNCILIFVKTIYITVTEKTNLIQNGQVSIKYKKASAFLSKATTLPFIGLLLVIPLLGILIAILYLFGQEPNSIIKAWTETADWTLSQKIAPQNIYYDQHYLCTVAAGGHEKVVKPIRSGMRHGHPVMVNRQLCVANAFEQVMEEKAPTAHKAIRTFYDKTGFPISKHIKSKITADIIYFLMKPLEWLFIMVLYFVDIHPEDRIAVQYPHTTMN